MDCQFLQSGEMSASSSALLWILFSSPVIFLCNWVSTQVCVANSHLNWSSDFFPSQFISDMSGHCDIATRVTPEMLLHNPTLLLHTADPLIGKYHLPLLFSFVV